MEKNYLKIALGIFAIFILIAPAMGALPDADRFDDLGQRVALVAMEELDFKYGDPDVVVLTDAGIAVVDGQTTEKAVSGITKVSGLQNGDANLFQIKRSEWSPLWFYFYNRDTGKGLYLVPDDNYYTMSASEVKKLPNRDAFATVALVTGDYRQLVEDSNACDETQKALGGNAFSLVSITNGWAHEAPYDLMNALSYHNHFCPGIGSGYLILKFIEEKLPLGDGTSYVAIDNPTWCKKDIYSPLWGMNRPDSSIVFTNEDLDELYEKYGKTPSGVFVRWNSKENTGDGVVVSFRFHEPKFDGSSWDINELDYYDMSKSKMSFAEKVYASVYQVENRDDLDEHVTIMKEFNVDEDMLSKLKDPLNNPYEVIGMM